MPKTDRAFNIPVSDPRCAPCLDQRIAWPRLKAAEVSGLILEEAPARAGEACSLDNYLVQPDESMEQRIAEARAKLAGDVVVLGHHYQRDEVIRFADFTGDSYKLAK